MPRKLRLCFDCEKPAHGHRCQPCASAYGTKNGTGIVLPGQLSNTHLFKFRPGEPKHLPAEVTWWDKVPREQWQSAYLREAARVNRGSGSNYRPTAMPSEWL